MNLKIVVACYFNEKIILHISNLLNTNPWQFLLFFCPNHGCFKIESNSNVIIITVQWIFLVHLRKRKVQKRDTPGRYTMTCRLQGFWSKTYPYTSILRIALQGQHHRIQLRCNCLYYHESSSVLVVNIEECWTFDHNTIFFSPEIFSCYKLPRVYDPVITSQVKRRHHAVTRLDQLHSADESCSDNNWKFQVRKNFVLWSKVQHSSIACIVQLFALPEQCNHCLL